MKGGFQGEGVAAEKKGKESRGKRGSSRGLKRKGKQPTPASSFSFACPSSPSVVKSHQAIQDFHEFQDPLGFDEGYEVTLHFVERRRPRRKLEGKRKRKRAGRERGSKT